LLRAAITFNLAVQSIDYRVDANVLGYTLGISLLAALLCSLAPALQSSRTDVNASLKDESRAVAAGRSKLRSVLVTGEVALALMLTCGAALLIFSVVTVASQNPGFVSERVLTANISLDDARYHDPARQFAFYRDVVARLGQLPGVVSAAASFDVPGTGAGSARLHLKGQEAPESMRPTVRDRLGTPDLLKTLQIPLLRGRNFTAQDDGNAPRVVLVDTTFVNRFFNGADPLGKEIGLDVGDSAEPEWAQIIGVVGGTKDFIALEQLEPVVYEAFAQRPRLQMSLLVRTVADPDALAPELRRAVWAVDSQMPVGQVETMRAVLDRVSKGNYIFSDMLATFSLIALLLAGIGIYGVVAYSVAQRTHEIGIRMALGADRVDVMRMVFGESLKLVIIGGAIGLAGASILPRTFDGMLPGFHVHGMWFFAVVPVTIAAIAALATYIPARRALRVDPMVALRYE
ncbi:MAG TPA: FtsX-like permease family protein, partial [Candidatus Acidoferrales bacterium]|nr:FtsX-like permease family protein [Candidatus Acidoferrales bacterium]